MEIAVAPVVKTHADLEDAVIERAIGRAGVAPEQLKGLVLLEELATIELFDARDERGCRRLVTAGARRLVDGAAGYALRSARGLAVAATCSRAPTGCG